MWVLSSAGATLKPAARNREEMRNSLGTELQLFVIADTIFIGDLITSQEQIIWQALDTKVFIVTEFTK